jgi:hypothetical protein
MEIIVVDPEGLDDYLYEFSTCFIKKDAAKRFDLLELCFLAGDPNLNPWSTHARKVNIYF